jgi:predicted amidohydrolase
MKIRIASIQLGIRECSKEETLAHVLELMGKAQGSDLILLPEIWPTGYFHFQRYAQDAESITGPLVRALQEKTSQLGCHVFMGSFVEREGADLFNTSLLLNPRGEIVTSYRKIHLFGYQSAESRLLKRGTQLGIAQLPWGKVGLSTCYDLRFPELYRKLVDEGVQAFLVTSAWPKVRLEAWTLFNRCRAHENLAHLISCNCAGQSQGNVFAGHSMTVDPMGCVLAEAGDEEQILISEIDTEVVDKVRKEFPALSDRVLNEKPVS